MTSRASAPSAGRIRDRSDHLFTALLFLVALLPRLWVAVEWAKEPVWDGHYYDFGARSIADGVGYGEMIEGPDGPEYHPWAHYPVGYSAFLAVFYKLFGPQPPVGTVAGALIGALTAALTHRAARYVTTRDRARVAGALVAASPGLLLYAGLLMTEPLAGFGLILSLWLALALRERSPIGALATSSFVLGLTALVRPQSLLLVAGLAALCCRFAIGAGAGRWRSILTASGRLAGLTLAGTLVAGAVIAPWTARNCEQMDDCALISTNGGWNLAIGSFPRATGRFETLRASDGCSVVTGQVQQDRCWWSQGVQWIQEDPERWIGLMPTKLEHTFDHESFPVGYLAEADPTAWPEPRRHHVRQILTASHRILLFLAALGAIAFVARPRDMRQAGRLGTVVNALGLLAALALGVHAADPIGSAWPLAVLLVVLAAFNLRREPSPASESRFLLGGRGYAALVVATVIATHAVFFGEDRYHVVATPLLCLLAGCALFPAASAGPRSAREPTSNRASAPPEGSLGSGSCASDSVSLR